MQSKTPETTLNADDLFALVEHNVGLRLTNCRIEKEQGGSGDSVPLSHLAGAKDIINFITLSCYLIEQQKLAKPIHSYQPILSQLEKIYNDYTDHKWDKDPTRASLTYLPKLIATYAMILKIGDAELTLCTSPRIPEKEEAVLLDMYHKIQAPLYLNHIFDKTSGYYEDTPTLRQQLTDNFNHLLHARLQLNYEKYISAKEMCYLLLTDKYDRFSYGYDLSRYPMGKTGSSEFSKKHVLHHYDFDAMEATDEHSQTHITSVFCWLKQTLTSLQIAKVPSQEQEALSEPSLKVAEPPLMMNNKEQTNNNPIMAFCSHYKTPITLGVLGLFATTTLIQTYWPKDDTGCKL